MNFGTDYAVRIPATQFRLLLVLLLVKSGVANYMIDAALIYKLLVVAAGGCMSAASAR